MVNSYIFYKNYYFFIKVLLDAPNKSTEVKIKIKKNIFFSNKKSTEIFLQ